MGSPQPPSILLSSIDYKFRMIFTEALACLFPYHLAMLVWQMMKGFLVLGACKMMMPSLLGVDLCPSQRHECHGGTFTRRQHY